MLPLSWSMGRPIMYLRGCEVLGVVVGVVVGVAFWLAVLGVVVGVAFRLVV